MKPGIWRLWAVALLLFCQWNPALAQDEKTKEGLPTFVVPDVAKKIKIIAYGDARFTDPVDTSHTNVIVRRALIDKIVQESPAALLFSGDMPYRGEKDEDWQEVDKEIKPLWDAKIRIYPALG